MLLEILMALVIILTAQFVYKRHKINKKLKGFVSPPGLPLFRHFFLFSSELGLIPNLLDTCKKYGNLIKLELFYGMPILLLTDKDLVSHILNTKQVVTKDTFYELAAAWIGDGLVVSAPSKWKKIRKLLNPAFNVQVIEHHVKYFEKHAIVLIEKLKNALDRGGFDVLPYISSCTLDIMCETVMGVTLNTQQGEHAQYIKDAHEATAIIVH
ncbi:hypothetical protein Trydic_g14465 [Trypoxylus dichotomus]